MESWGVSENSQSETKWEISSAKQRLYLDGDYSHWSLENHITFPSFTERQQGERGGGGDENERAIIRRYHFHPSSDEGKSSLRICILE